MLKQRHRAAAPVPICAAADTSYMRVSHIPALHHSEVRVGERQPCSDRGELDCPAGNIAVGVVDQGTGGLVVDDAVIGIVRLRADMKRILGQRACRIQGECVGRQLKAANTSVASLIVSSSTEKSVILQLFPLNAVLKTNVSLPAPPVRVSNPLRRPACRCRYRIARWHRLADKYVVGCVAGACDVALPISVKFSTVPFTWRPARLTISTTLLHPCRPRYGFHCTRFRNHNSYYSSMSRARSRCRSGVDYDVACILRCSVSSPSPPYKRSEPLPPTNVSLPSPPYSGPNLHFRTVGRCRLRRPACRHLCLRPVCRILAYRIARGADIADKYVVGRVAGACKVVASNQY